MTVLGEMIWNDGLVEGERRGSVYRLLKAIPV